MPVVNFCLCLSKSPWSSIGEIRRDKTAFISIFSNFNFKTKKYIKIIYSFFHCLLGLNSVIINLTQDYDGDTSRCYRGLLCMTHEICCEVWLRIQQCYDGRTSLSTIVGFPSR